MVFGGVFPPHHLVHYAHVALDDLHHLGGDIFIRVVRNRGAVVAVLDKFYSRVDGLEKSFGVDAGENKACLVERLGTFGRGTDADCRKRMSYAGEERTLLGKGPRNRIRQRRRSSEDSCSRGIPAAAEPVRADQA